MCQRQCQRTVRSKMGVFSTLPTRIQPALCQMYVFEETACTASPQKSGCQSQKCSTSKSYPAPLENRSALGECQNDPLRGNRARVSQGTRAQSQAGGLQSQMTAAAPAASAPSGLSRRRQGWTTRIRQPRWLAAPEIPPATPAAAPPPPAAARPAPAGGGLGAKFHALVFGPGFATFV